MKVPAEFDEVRPYNPEELPQVFDELLSDPSFQAVVSHVMPGVPLELIARRLRACRTNLDVQKAFFHRLLHDIMDKCSDGFTMDTRSVTDHTRNYTFVSNHRDIVLDPGFLSVGLIDNGFPTTVEIAIGDNLLIYPWIKKLVRVNKSFIVQRSISLRQVLESSARMSRYIHFAVTQKHENVWIAQREGRAKDSNDRTQESVLKMLAMGGEGDVVDRLLELNIVPTALSYEFDPCDFLKAKEMQQKRDIPGFKKSRQDDLDNMQTGIFGYKGRVNFVTAPCINPQLEELRGLPKNEFFARLAALVDRGIHAHYHLYPCNYIASDWLEGTTAGAAHYTEEDCRRFEGYLAKKLSLIDLPDKDEAFLRRCLLVMYANPAINHRKALEA